MTTKKKTAADDGWLDRPVWFRYAYDGCLARLKIAAGTRAHVVGKLDTMDTVAVQFSNGDTARVPVDYLGRIKE